MTFDFLEKLQKELIIENKDWNLKWGTKLSELISFSQTNKIEGNEIYLYFGELTILNNLNLKLGTPFDTIKSNDGKTLNHLGTNLDLEDIPELIKKLTETLGDPNETSDIYGTYRKWKKDKVYIEIMPRYHHGSDWSSFIIGVE